MTETSEMAKIASQYAPLVKATAARYQGRGAEYEDLVQEGYMALVILVPQCADRRWLPYFLKTPPPLPRPRRRRAPQDARRRRRRSPPRRNRRNRGR